MDSPSEADRIEKKKKKTGESASSPKARPRKASAGPAESGGLEEVETKTSPSRLGEAASEAPETSPVLGFVPGEEEDLESEDLDVEVDRPIGLERERTRRYTQISERNRCRFCRDKVKRVDYKDILVLQKLCSAQGRILSRKKSGNCAAHQRQVKRAIKQARYIGLLSFTT